MSLAIEKFVNDCCKSLDAYLSTEYYYSYLAGNDAKLTINGEDDLTKYVIVRPRYNVSYLTTLETDKLIKAIRQMKGKELKVNLDTAKPAEYEIIIGNADRDGVEKIEDRDTYKIYTKGKKVYINGGRLDATTLAVTEFTKLVKNGGALEDGKVITGSYKKTVETYDKTEYYTATMFDDFDGDTLNEEYWDPRDNEGDPFEKGKVEVKPRNLSVKDGNLVLNTTKDGPNYYVGAGFTSQKKAWFKYGYFEMSAILADTNGFYTSFWLLGSSSDNPHVEFDIFEKFANNEQRIKHTTLNHPGGFNYYDDKVNYENSKIALPEGERWSDTYHTIGMLWTEDYAQYTIDGIPTVYTNFNLYPTRFGISCKKYAFMQGSIIANYMCQDPNHPVPANQNGVMGIDETTDWENNKYIIDYILAFQREGEGGVKFR